MPDEVDQITAREDQILAARIKAVRTGAKRRELAPRGKCLYCEEPFPTGDSRLFCDEDCRDDHLKYIKQGN
jgi:5-methylcytosine-specific restriction endonuclease McrA